MPTSSLVVFSDLDGTLLDHSTYEHAAAREALERLRVEGVPLVLCTSKTRAEVEPLRRALDNRHPFIVENGGGLFVPSGYFPFPIANAERRGDYEVIAFGRPYRTLVDALAAAARETGANVRGFATMDDAEVASVTGLPLDTARLARQREFDEPFLIMEMDRRTDLLAAIERRGYRWTAGGRFYHIMGSNDKAAAVSRLLTLYRQRLGRVHSMGLGDAPNDAEFLNIVDLPVLIASPRLDRLRALVPGGTATVRPGPAGWNDAVLAALAAPR